VQKLKQMSERLSVLEEDKSEEDTFDYSLLSVTAINDILDNTDENNSLDLSGVTDETLDELEAAFVRKENANAEN